MRYSFAVETPDEESAKARVKDFIDSASSFGLTLLNSDAAVEMNLSREQQEITDETKRRWDDEDAKVRTKSK